MDSMKFLCSRCAKEIKAPVAQADKWFKCPLCNEVTRVPDFNKV